jgi:polysaccharide biosynthesis transport protein
LTDDQAESVLGIRMASAIPRIRGSGSSDSSMADLMSTAPLSPFPESVRRIRVTMDQTLRRLAPAHKEQSRPPGSVVMITSSTVDEGKSTIALSLARAYAAARVRVCLVDCDLRRPAIHALVGRQPSSGLTDFLLQSPPTRPAEELIERDPLSEARIVTGGQRFDLPTDYLIGGVNFRVLIEQLRAEYDMILLDTPPIGPVADSLYLANHADMVLFVVMAGRTSQTEARLALSSLSNAIRPETAVLGVLNGQEAASAHYKGSYGGYYLRD